MAVRWSGNEVRNDPAIPARIGRRNATARTCTYLYKKRANRSGALLLVRGRVAAAATPSFLASACGFA
jgi:hypothetical protein